MVFITGVSSGIGAATARLLGAAGYRVFGGARDPERIQAAPGVELVACDVRDEISVRTAVDQIIDRAGRIDVLVNNAGVSLAGPIEATSVEEAQALFDTNVFGALRTIRSVLPDMRARRSGLIVNVSSVLGFLPAPFMGLYAASKHAIEGLSETLDHEVRNLGIRVVLLEPSFTRTNLDLGSKRTAAVIADYADALARSHRAVVQQIATAPRPETVAEKIAAIIKGPHRLREPADRRARLLRTLRRYAPVKGVDSSLRKTFGL
ncbi:oxidoreductase [Acetobacteraceae bacterium KSS8]|uniref:Oxidoreductase n=1 Tax=Endosaccharibacter trunci TaxID=2812733 RepID=A0ABT1W5E5_9PROT|nr:oxidoreductase [Acetobacteraceae bacterium KSS8]